MCCAHGARFRKNDRSCCRHRQAAALTGDDRLKIKWPSGLSAGPLTTTLLMVDGEGVERGIPTPLPTDYPVFRPRGKPLPLAIVAQPFQCNILCAGSFGDRSVRLFAACSAPQAVGHWWAREPLPSSAQSQEFEHSANRCPTSGRGSIRWKSPGEKTDRCRKVAFAVALPIRLLVSSFLTYGLGLLYLGRGGGVSSPMPKNELLNSVS